MPSAVSTVNGDQSVKDLRRELAEAREQQAVSTEILATISSSATDANQVFAKIAASAARLCDAYDAAILRVDCDNLRIAAHHGPIPPLGALPLTRGFVTGSAVLDRRTIHVADLHAESSEYPESSDQARLLDHRTILAVPLIRGSKAIGAIVIRRTEVRPFTDRQIDLVKTFADQAVIAIENTRLFEEVQARTRELAESLEYQTATAEVLGVISRSPTDVQPVFSAIASSAAKLCNALDAAVLRVDGYMLRLVAHHGLIPIGDVPLHRGTVGGRTVIERRLIHVDDLQAEEVEYPEGSEFAKHLGHRTTLSVPLLKEGVAIGNIQVRRDEVRPFTAKQIALVQIFADQAVIAIENARLFEAEQERTKELQARTRELTESLDYQTAISEVLGVISRSPNELQPVLDSIVEITGRLCEADHAHVFRLRDGKYHLAAHNQTDPHIAEYLANNPIGLDQLGSVTARAARARKTVHVPDAMQDPEYGHGPLTFSNDRTVLSVPLLREGTALGVVTVGRRTLRPFSGKEIRLIETFADQAVIAVENTRLFEEVQTRNTELRVALEQQTATSELLKVIGRSTFDLQPVFESLAESAVRLCEAEHAFVFLYDGHLLRSVASHNIPPGLRAFVEANPIRPGRESAAARAANERRTIHIEDIRADPEFTYGVVHVGPMRTVLAIPMLRADELLGVIVITRPEVRLFTHSQIALMETFADQAVIAIENTRLFEAEQTRTRELTERTQELTETLEYQTAISEVLNIISRSPSELQPVVDIIVQTAKRLCSAERAMMWRLREAKFSLVAQTITDPALIRYLKENPLAASRDSLAGRAVLERRTIHTYDITTDPELRSQEQALASKLRTLLVVPLLRADEPVGVLSLARTKVQPFTDKQVELVTTFADQAVIAIENARLFEELQARNRDLTALGEVGRAVSCTLDLKTVLKTIVDRAVELSATDAGSIFYYRGGRFELGETTGLNEEAIARFRKLDIAAGQTGLGEAIDQRQPLQVPDIFQRPSNPLRDAAIEAGLRAGLIVPLFGSEGPLGALVLQRRRLGEFPPAVVSLMQAFADQSAIALENARLFNEIAQKSRELEIASQHKSQFVANMSHELRTPLAAILGYAELMQEGFYEPQGPKSLDALTRIRSNGKHLLGLINTVLDIAKIESGQFSLNMAEYAIDNMVETVRAATESLAQNKNLALKTDVAKSLPIGVGDEQRLTQVLLNLVGNAIKFTDRGEVRVTAKAANGHFAISVADTGPGIPEHERNRIFEQFHQIDSSNTKAKGGTGLGLAIAKRIVEMHGGRIWVESTVGKGSTFRMELPARAEFRNAP